MRKIHCKRPRWEIDCLFGRGTREKSIGANKRVLNGRCFGDGAKGRLEGGNLDWSSCGRVQARSDRPRKIRLEVRTIV